MIKYSALRPACEVVGFRTPNLLSTANNGSWIWYQHHRCWMRVDISYLAYSGHKLEHFSVPMAGVCVYQTGYLFSPPRYSCGWSLFYLVTAR